MSASISVAGVGSGTGVEVGSGIGVGVGSGTGVEVGSGTGVEVGTGIGVEVGSGSLVHAIPITAKIANTIANETADLALSFTDVTVASA